MITIFHYLEARCRLILMHAQVSLTMGLVMVMIILKVAKFLEAVSKFKNLTVFAFFTSLKYTYTVKLSTLGPGEK